jgi:hypothetical protein
VRVKPLGLWRNGFRELKAATDPWRGDPNLRTPPVIAIESGRWAAGSAGGRQLQGNERSAFRAAADLGDHDAVAGGAPAVEAAPPGEAPLTASAEAPAEPGVAPAAPVEDLPVPEVAVAPSSGSPIVDVLTADGWEVMD